MNQFYKKTVRDVPLDDQRVLLRADYNVPLAKDGTIADDYRMTQSLPTIRHLLERGCSVVICAHLGRPKGQVTPKYSLEPVAAHLGELLGMPVGFMSDCIGDKVRQATKRLGARQVLLLENLRFHPEEEANDAGFAQQLAKDSGANYFIQDGFGVVHRAHASTAAITQWLPGVSGLLLEREVTTITNAMRDPERPLVAILGGAKVSDKIAVIERFIDIADKLIIGGAMANTFLQYKGVAIGKSIYEPGQETEVKRIFTKALRKIEGKCSLEEFLFLPIDVAVAKAVDGSDLNRRVVDLQQVAADDYIVDVGDQSIARMREQLRDTGTIIWNGTMGLAEYEPFAWGSAQLAEVLAAQRGQTLSIIGGGDTAEFVLGWDPQHGKSFGHVSTGGGASMELMAGQKLPGVEALLDR